MHIYIYDIYILIEWDKSHEIESQLYASYYCSTLCVLFHPYSFPSRSAYLCLYHTSENRDTRDFIFCPRSLCCQVTKPRFKPKLSRSKALSSLHYTTLAPWETMAFLSTHVFPVSKVVCMLLHKSCPHTRAPAHKVKAQSPHQLITAHSTQKAKVHREAPGEGTQTKRTPHIFHRHLFSVICTLALKQTKTPGESNWSIGFENK